MQTHTWDISNCLWGDFPAQRMTCGTTWLDNPCCRTPTSSQTPLGYKDNIALGRLQKNNQGCTIFTASRIKTNFKYTLHTNLLFRRHFEAVPECCAQSLPVAVSVTAPLKVPAQFDKLLRPIYTLRFVVPICRPREIVKQIGFGLCGRD